MKYILDDNHHVIKAGLEQWARWSEDLSKRRVDETRLSNGVRVSTVFLGLDHRFDDKGPPLVFETMIFGGPLDQHMWRYSSWDDAVTGHAVAVRKAITRAK